MRRRSWWTLLLVVGTLLVAPPVLAHPLDVGLADVTVRDAEVELRLSVNLFELDLLLSLDRDRDGRVARDEVEGVRPQIITYLAGTVRVLVGGQPLPMEAGPFDLRQSADGKPTFETTLRFRAPRPLRAFTIRCEPLTEFGADHAIIARISREGRSEQFVFRKGLAYEAEGRSASAYVVQFLGLGIHHIFVGYDHLAFLVALILISPGVLSVVKIVTSFTLAHSITLSLAALDVVSLPGRLVEAAIALSVAYVAAENLLVETSNRRWLVSLLFGFVHGFGFAAILKEMSLPREGLVTSLFLFNIGVEVGQLLVIAVLLPILWLLARTPAYPATVKSASVGILGLAVVWFFQRVF